VRITEVRIKLMEEPGERLKAFCSVTFDDCFVVRDLKIIEGTNGPFVAMPSRKLTSHCPKCGMKNHLRAAHCNHCGSRLEDGRAPKDADGRAKLYADIAHPINSDCREMIQESVIREFYDEIERAKQPGYVSRYDDFDLEYAEAPRPRPARVDQPHRTPAPASRKYPSPTSAGPAPRASANQRAANHPSDVRPQHRNDPPGDLPRSADTAEAPKGDNFGAGIFPER
jgi:stage V sporulation protein G